MGRWPLEGVRSPGTLWKPPLLLGLAFVGHPQGGLTSTLERGGTGEKAADRELKDTCPYHITRQTVFVLLGEAQVTLSGWTPPIKRQVVANRLR